MGNSDHGNDPHDVLDLVQNSIRPYSCGVETFELVPQRLANLMRVRGERSCHESNDRIEGFRREFVQ